MQFNYATSKSPLLPELVENMEPGILCPLDVILKIVVSIVQLYKNRNLTKRSDMVARERVVKEYSLEAMMTDILKSII